MAAEAEVAPGLIKARAAETAETIAGRELIKYEDEPLSPSFAAVGHRLKFFGDLQEPEYQEEHGDGSILGGDCCVVPQGPGVVSDIGAGFKQRKG